MVDIGLVDVEQWRAAKTVQDDDAHLALPRSPVPSPFLAFSPSVSTTTLASVQYEAHLHPYFPSLLCEQYSLHISHYVIKTS